MLEQGLTSVFDTSRRVLVVGDVMLDRYFEGETARISPEAPVPVLKVEQAFARAGGAANVAVNIAALGMPVTLLAYVGADADAATLSDLLSAAGVECHFVTAPGRCTIVKLRALSKRQQMLRIDFEDGFADCDHDELLAHFASLSAVHDLVILSDYAKGTLAAVAAMITAARSQNKRTLVDPKGRDFSRYRGATVITPNLSEFRAVVGDVGDEAALLAAAQKLRSDLALDHVLVTRGEQGMTLVSAAESPHTIATRAQEVYDVTGAGDTVIATLAGAVASGMSFHQAVEVANAAAAIVVGRKGTASVTAAELAQFVGHSGPKPTEAAAVLAAIDAEKARGERIVFTNGCFDILHAGHVDYLQRARALGNRLVVAVNSDASVARLKGPDRPFNALEARMAVLAALGCVDHVVAFDHSILSDGRREDTPRDIITRLRPDVLVKGGDYTPDTIVGAEEVKGWGGEVVILPFVAGHSTSAIAARIKALG